ncbi:MAG: Ig-like domain-containing protein, partial [Methylocella sp.]
TNTVIATIPVGEYPLALGKFIGGPSHGSPPVAVNETATTAANTPVTIDLTAGASGNPTSATLIGTPVGGTVAGFPATTVTFTPATGFSGAASFQFTLANAFGTSNTATATITVTPPSPPVAVPETASTTAGTPVTIDLSVGASGSPTSATIVSGPTQGMLKFISNTMVTYRLTACFLGTDSFTFKLANAYGTSNVARRRLQ